MLRQDLNLGDDLAGDNCGERRVFSIKKFSKAIEVGEGSVRPFQLHRLRQLWNAGVPQV